MLASTGDLCSSIIRLLNKWKFSVPTCTIIFHRKNYINTLKGL